MAVPYTFANSTTTIPLSQLDSNFATAITLGNTSLYLGNTTTSVGNLTLTNVTISSVSTPITVAQGGTGLSSTPAAGQLDIGNGTGFTRATLTAGSGVSITNANGSITISATGSGGTVSNVSIVSANGFAGTVANSTTNAAITLSTSISGVLKGNGTAISAATSGTDYAPATSGTSILYGNGSGGFSNVTVGTGLSFAAGTLSATGGGGSTSIGLVRAISINCILC